MIDAPFQRAWLDAQQPFEFALSPEGSLLISFQVNGYPMGFAVPSAELENLQQLLATTETIRDMLGAKPPAQGAH